MFAITKENAEKIFNYLIERPFKEVEPLVEIFRSLQPITLEGKQEPVS